VAGVVAGGAAAAVTAMKVMTAGAVAAVVAAAVAAATAAVASTAAAAAVTAAAWKVKNKMNCEKKEIIDTRNAGWKGKCAMMRRNTVKKSMAEVQMMISTSVIGGRNNVFRGTIMVKF
jgi:outer membrane receptor protein involved in Fe transport